MSSLPRTPPSQQMGRFCWSDLSTGDPAAATSFYGRLFGWHAQEHRIGQGRFSTLAKDGAAFASLYQLTHEQVARGVPSLWLPYVSVADVDKAALKVAVLGGEVIVTPQDVDGFARICVIADPTGALIGLWQAESAHKGPRSHGGPERLVVVHREAE
jgi:predicted enzyme related to lactoylglutathione lyase